MADWKGTEHVWGSLRTLEGLEWGRRGRKIMEVDLKHKISLLMVVGDTKDF